MDGKYKVISGGEKLSKDDVLKLSMLAQDKNWYDRAIGFLQAATQ